MKQLNQKVKRCLTATVAFIALGSLCVAAHAQSNDALLDALIKKGILTKDEATAIQTEAAQPGTVAMPVRELSPITADPEFKSILDKAINERLDGKWYNKLKLAGYTQVRYTSLFNQSGAVLNVPNDGSARDSESLRIRRGRIKFSGDVAERLYLYAQMDFAASVGGGFALQMRDLYGDLALDANKEFRVRLGQSKVPFGFVNLQSSQNRPTLERADGINSAAENERDIAAIFYWTPTEVQKRFKEMKKLGLKHSGNYGMLGLGIYNGQGPNRNDVNGAFHTVARATYPFKFDNGRFLELGVQAYHGEYQVSTVDPDGLGLLVTPSAGANGTTDQRVGGSIILYPQPWGVEAEWNVGRGPTLSPDLTRVDSTFLHGGYLMAYYQKETSWGRFFPYVRWNYYDGGRKFAANAPGSVVNEMDFGVEWSPWPYAELSVQYTKTFERTNTGVAPYASTTDADRVGFQLQFNY
ncbi:MAG: hypothetical protein ACI9VS_000456 [Candidatus Binatia bacterium]|jgi:hypothetical protein